MRRTAEFDAFGPWIYQVRTASDLPRLYRAAGIDPAAHRLVLKVPRNVERRYAHPDMDLYDYLIAVDDRAVTVLRRHDDRYDTLRVEARRIIAIEESVSMLDGRLTLHTADGAGPAIAYNAADLPPVRALIDLIRELYLPAPAAPVAPAPVGAEPDLGPADIGLVTAYRHLIAAEPGLRLVGAFPRQVLGGLRPVRPVTLHASLVLADAREIQLLHRRDRITRGNAKVLSNARTILPRARITDVRVRPHERYRGVDVVTVDGHLSFPVSAGPGTDTLLSALGAHRS